MSRIKGIEVKTQKDVPPTTRKNGNSEVSRKKDEDLTKEEAEKRQMAALRRALPELDALVSLWGKVGEGTFSCVYAGWLRAHAARPPRKRRWFAVKHLVPTAHPARVEHELRCLRDIGGKDNVVGVDLCLRHLDTIVFIMPYLPHKKFSEYVSLMDAGEARSYLRALLLALRRVHAFGVIHRDVKPSNFLYDRDNRRYLLVDFGLAQRIGGDTRVSVPRIAASGTTATVGNAATVGTTAAVENAATAATAATGKTTAVANGPASLKRPREQEASSPPAAKRVALDLTVGSNVKPAEATQDSYANTMPEGPRGTKCACWGRGGVCGACAGRGAARACRAGTSGFRPPEVLLKCHNQDTAVDMWAVGVILASVLSARYPFFRAADDGAALAELADLLGTKPLQRTAQALGRRLLMSRERRGLCLRKLCARLRACPGGQGGQEGQGGQGGQGGAPCEHCRVPLAECLCRDDTPADLFRAGVVVAGFPDAAFALAARLLDPHPATRITAEQALLHPFITGHC